MLFLKFKGDIRIHVQFVSTGDNQFRAFRRHENAHALTNQFFHHRFNMNVSTDFKAVCHTNQLRAEPNHGISA